MFLLSRGEITKEEDRGALTTVNRTVFFEMDFNKNGNAIERKRSTKVPVRVRHRQYGKHHHIPLQYEIVLSFTEYLIIECNRIDLSTLNM